MITIPKPIKDSAQWVHYPETADYYAKPAATPDLRFAIGARPLGFSVSVEGNGLKRPFSGLPPGDGPSLARHWFSASPSVRPDLEQVHNAAVRAACEYLEAQAGIALRGNRVKAIPTTTTA